MRSSPYLGRIGAALAMALVVASSAVPPAQGSATRVFPLAVHLATTPSDDFLATRIRQANALFAPADVGFRIASTTTIPDEHAFLLTRDDRDRLGRYHTERAIDVFVVSALIDVDTPPLPRRGVHWRDRGRPGVRYVIVIALSSEWVLPHELGHYFGLGHSDVTGNLMSYSRGDGDPFLDATQLTRIRGTATRLARSMRVQP